LDNASVQTRHAFLSHADEWMQRGVCLHFLPPYSPELNPIEILWRKIKYEWLPLDAYTSYAHLK
jgi:transposase